MTDGIVIVNGPIQQMNSALDYDAFFNITGGFLVAAGSAGMAQAPGAASTQNSLLLNFSGTQKAGTLVHIQTNSGKDVLTFAPSKQYQSIAFSSPALVTGATYDVYTGGSSTGVAQDGVSRRDILSRRQVHQFHGFESCDGDRRSREMSLGPAHSQQRHRNA